MTFLKTLISSVAITLIASGCLSHESNGTKDLFIADEAEGNGNSRRHRATDDEVRWSISMNRCSGHLISPNYMMTAHHCIILVRVGEKFTSGFGERNETYNDIEVVEVTESNYEMDYAILKIVWANGFPKEQNFSPLIATSKDDVEVSPEVGKGDLLFTVGFPLDKQRTWNATYSEGRAKKSDAKLYFNVGITSGNSGGGVWRKSDNMLVALSNYGPTRFGRDGWNHNELDDESHWNHGISMWEVYAVSKTLQDIFPDGKNRFTRN